MIGDQADKMCAQWQAHPNENKFKKNVSYKRKPDPPQSHMVEKQKNEKGRKRPAVLMFEKNDGESTELTNDNMLEMENFNYDRHSLIDEDEFTDSLSELDPTFIDCLKDTM